MESVTVVGRILQYAYVVNAIVGIAKAVAIGVPTAHESISSANNVTPKTVTFAIMVEEFGDVMHVNAEITSVGQIIIYFP